MEEEADKRWRARRRTQKGEAAGKAGRGGETPADSASHAAVQRARDRDLGGLAGRKEKRKEGREGLPVTLSSHTLLSGLSSLTQKQKRGPWGR